MHQYSFSNKLFTPENIKCFEINKESPPVTCSNFLNGLLNAKNILHSLEKSLKKTRSYEDQLLSCKSKHPHQHNKENESDVSNIKCSNASEAEKSKSSRNPVDLTETWSTMSIVCLQYQYEELSSRYESLLRAYDDRSRQVDSRNETVSRLRERMSRNHIRLVEANKALLAVGERYMKLRQKRLIEKHWFEERIEHLKQRIQDVVRTAERARLELDDQLEIFGDSGERDASLALLLEEVKKCNMLFLENIQLKSMLEDFVQEKEF